MDLPQIICLAIFGGVPVWSLEKNTSSYSVFALEATAFTVKSRSQIGMPQKIPMRLEQHLGMISMATKATATTAKQEQTHLRSSPSPPPHHYHHRHYHHNGDVDHANRNDNQDVEERTATTTHNTITDADNNLPIGSIVVPFWDYLIGF